MSNSDESKYRNTRLHEMPKTQWFWLIFAPLLLPIRLLSLALVTIFLLCFRNQFKKLFEQSWFRHMTMFLSFGIIIRAKNQIKHVKNTLVILNHSYFLDSFLYLYAASYNFIVADTKIFGILEKWLFPFCRVREITFIGRKDQEKIAQIVESKGGLSVCPEAGNKKFNKVIFQFYSHFFRMYDQAIPVVMDYKFCFPIIRYYGFQYKNHIAFEFFSLFINPITLITIENLEMVHNKNSNTEEFKNDVRNTMIQHLGYIDSQYRKPVDFKEDR